jgi:ligand-binding sensor domain-containing protein
MEILEISNKDFEEIDCARQVISHQYSRRFASVKIDEVHGTYGISWSSDSIEPVVLNMQNTSTVWIGVDQSLVAISLSRGNVTTSLRLDTNILEVKSVGTVLIALTESEVLMFNADGSLRCIKSLPEIGADLSIVENTISVQLIDDSTLNFDLYGRELLAV